MKPKQIMWILAILILVIITNSCGKEENENPFNEEAKKNYEAVVTLQEECEDVLAGYNSTMDSAQAVEALASWFRNQALVEWAEISSQGISVSYTNGMYGGILLNPESQDSPAPAAYRANVSDTINLSGKLKNTPTYKKARVAAAALDEFPNIFMYQIQNWTNMLNEVDISCVYNQNNEVKLEYLSSLESRHDGIISLNSHGMAWPSNNNIEEVYFLTGESELVNTSERYYEDLIEKRVILIRYKNASRYCIAPDFITKYNDFSKDTVLFYGSFCYSFMGSWPNIVDDCASGTYFGFDWAVRSGKCAEWAVDLINYLSFENIDQPYTVEDWMTKSEIPKSYFEENYNKNVSIHYNGNSALTLWEPEYNADGIIEAVAADGMPISIPGNTCKEYLLRCKVNGQLPAQVSYYWDLGSGQNYGQEGNQVTCLWIMPGNYTVTVQVKNDATDEVLKELSAQVQIEDPSFLPFLQQSKKLNCLFDPSCITLTDGSQAPIGFFSFWTDELTTPLTWNGTSFYAQYLDSSDVYVQKRQLTGEISSDGKVLNHMLWTYIVKHNGNLDFEVILEISDIPILVRDEWNCTYGFSWDFNGAESQTYIDNLQYKNYDYQTEEWVTIQSVNWSASMLHGFFYYN